jgi:hypothetical protein
MEDATEKSIRTGQDRLRPMVGRSTKGDGSRVDRARSGEVGRMASRATNFSMSDSRWSGIEAWLGIATSIGGSMT